MVKYLLSRLILPYRSTISTAKEGLSRCFNCPLSFKLYILAAKCFETIQFYVHIVTTPFHFNTPSFRSIAFRCRMMQFYHLSCSLANRCHSFLTLLRALNNYRIRFRSTYCKFDSLYRFVSCDILFSYLMAITFIVTF